MRFSVVLQTVRAWVIGFVVWGIALGASGLDVSNNDTTAAQGRGAATVFALLATVMLVKAVWPMRVSRSDPWRLIGGGRSYHIHSFTGTTANVTKLPITQIHGSSTASTQLNTGIGGDVYGSMSHTTTIRSSTIMFDQFFLVDGRGQQRGFQVGGLNLEIGNGQIVSGAWAVRPGRPTGKYLAFVNHSTGTTTFSKQQIRRIALGTRRRWVVLALLLTGLCLAIGGEGGGAVGVVVGGLLLFEVVARLQAARFTHSTARPMLAALDGVAATMSPAHPSAPIPVQAAPQVQLAAAAPALPAELPAALPAAPPAGLAPPAAAAGWLPDPSTRHELRYWDGMRWTDHVTDAGTPGTDRV